MDIKNIALVRATNVIPLDGVVKPLSEVPYVTKETGTTFSYAMSDLLKKLGIIPPIDMAKYFTMTDEEQEQVAKDNKKILDEYMPYSSDYNSMVLWALNGLVPDDINNTFSDKDVAIIESLEEQVEKGNVPVSIMPTDTAIKGKIELSPKATIIIRKERFDSMTDEEKDMLSKLNVNIKLFEGELQEKVGIILDRDENFAHETLSLNREKRGYEESDTKEELLNAIDEEARKRNIPQVLFFNLVTGQHDEQEGLKEVDEEFKNSVTVSDCYKKTFLNYLFSSLEMDESVKVNALTFMDSEVYTKDLVAEIEKVGIEKYKEVVDSFNQTIDELREEGSLPTPQEIVEKKKEDKDYTLNDLIDEFESRKKTSDKDDDSDKNLDDDDGDIDK